ncbi:2Fe-2S iron-sulfur cluster-binding protein [Streptomyces sp. NPDC058683]|uniref:2Fe-2S iron-sulfur cluster-binding protein n=1 Tax=Streptomyces sp. NPDC058683 TaxID=3346597 RepID=UPI0036493792
MPLNRLTLMPEGVGIDLPQGSPLTGIENKTSEPLIPFGCRSGACGACVVEVLAGSDALGETDPDEADFLEDLGWTEGNYRLACQCSLWDSATIRVVAS